MRNLLPHPMLSAVILLLSIVLGAYAGITGTTGDIVALSRTGLVLSFYWSVMVLYYAFEDSKS